MENKKYSCIDCIWYDQCSSDEPCEFFDRGRSDSDLSDEDIELRVELGRKEYDQAYQKYIREFYSGV